MNCHLLSFALIFSLCSWSCVQSLEPDDNAASLEAGGWAQPLSSNDGGILDRSDDVTLATSDPGARSPQDAGVFFGADAGDESGDAGEGASVDAGGSGNASAIGTFHSPIVVDNFPATFRGDTTEPPSEVAATYTPCAPSTQEGGGEYVYVVNIPPSIEASILTISVDDNPQDAVDIDLHFLEAPSPTSCFARHNRQLSIAVAPGETLYVSADTWTNGAGISLEGAFVLSFSLEAVSVESCFENPTPQCTSAPTLTTLPVAAAGIGGCPDGMTPAGIVCVDVYEASLVEVLADGTLFPVSPFENPGNKRVRAVSASNIKPQAYISGQQAARACESAGKRLCSENEWERACRGANDFTYPYGDVREPGRCNDARTCHPAVQFFESNQQWVFGELDHPCINQLPSSLDATGANTGCRSPEGAFDMMGNLHEWTSNTSGVFRGGYYVDTYRNGDGCEYRTGAHNFSYSDYSTGFRCCADPL